MEIGAKTRRVIACAQRRAPMVLRAPEGVGSSGDMGVRAYSGLTTKTAGNDGEGGGMRQKEDQKGTPKVPSGTSYVVPGSQKGGGVGRLAHGKLALALWNQPGPV